jgi:hypothetical protein
VLPETQATPGAEALAARVAAAAGRVARIPGADPGWRRGLPLVGAAVVEWLAAGPLTPPA